jgi:hypothetical protein
MTFFFFTYWFKGATLGPPHPLTPANRCRRKACILIQWYGCHLNLITSQSHTMDDEWIEIHELTRFYFPYLSGYHYDIFSNSNLVVTPYQVPRPLSKLYSLTPGSYLETCVTMVTITCVISIVMQYRYHSSRRNDECFCFIFVSHLTEVPLLKLVHPRPSNVHGYWIKTESRMYSSVKNLSRKFKIFQTASEWHFLEFEFFCDTHVKSLLCHGPQKIFLHIS